MGSKIITSKIDTHYSTTQTFNSLKEEDRNLYGVNDYAGSFYNTKLIGSYKNNENYSEKNTEEIMKKIKIKESVMQIGTTYCYSLGVVGYLVRTVIKKSTNYEKAKFKKGFLVSYKKDGEFLEKSFEDRNGAIDFCNKIGFEGAYLIKIAEEYTVQGNPNILKFEVEQKEYVKKPTKLKANQKCFPIYRYYYIGLVRE